jgi:hypothetical protein
LTQSERNLERPLFQLFLLKNDREDSVEIREVERIDPQEIEKHLELGDRVFITSKREPNVNKNLIQEKAADRDSRGFMYVAHV